VRHAVPPDLVHEAAIKEMPDVRSYFDTPNPLVQRSLIRSLEEEDKDDYPPDALGVRTYPMLDISGGAANGAYGAGLLKGWSEEGSRPKFKIVTGISTGALIAPFAFLGSSYDAELEKCYTTVSTKDVMKLKGPLTALFGDSFASSRPLMRYIAGFVTDKMLEEIAKEHRRGRRLFVGTSNLDTQNLMLWDMGAIASRGGPRARELFCKILLASASIPIMFPPVYFEVEAGGRGYDEMHVDGGMVTQVFHIYGLLRNMEGAARERGIDPAKFRPKLYIIRNGYVSSNWKEVEDNLIGIAERSLDTIVNFQAVGDTYRIYTFTKSRGGDFNLAYIPADFKQDPKEPFDKAVMDRLFRRGYEDGRAGYKWHKAPPGMKEVTGSES
jgi:hypothetical protein